MRLKSQFNLFPGEDPVREHPTQSKPGCKHDFSEWTAWTSLNSEFRTRYGRHCAHCPKWEFLSTRDTDPPFSYNIETVPTGGILLKLKYNLTGQVKEFFVKGMQSPCPMEMHMRNMTDDLMLSWFVTRERKKKEKRGKEVA